jgi:hypothetical protein
MDGLCCITAPVPLRHQAADQGHANAQYNLGQMYFNGRGVPQDYILAHMWANLGASSLSGDDGKLAATNRDIYAGKMTPAQIEPRAVQA